MKSTVLSAALLALAACGAEGAGGDGYPAPAGSGTSGLGAAGTTLGGQGAAGSTPTAGSSGQPPAAGATAMAGTGGRQGTAGMMSTAGTGTSGQGGMGTAGGAGGQTSTAGTTGGNTAGTVTVEFTTVSYEGRYAPSNYGAVWFESASGTFIKTAKRWAGTVHATDLVEWTAASGGWGTIFGGGNMADMMDAMSSATLRTHQSHTVTWNMMGTDKQVVPDGNYVAVVEMTESRAADNAGALVRIEFTKGPNPQMVEPPAAESITGIKLRYTP